LRLFQRESGNLVGVDISPSAVKVVELTGHSGIHLKSMAIVPMTVGAIVDNTIVDSKAVTLALKQAYKIARPSTDRVCFGMAGNAVIMKTVIMPLMSEFELESQINFEAEQLLPFDIDEVYLDFQILGEVPHDPESMEVIIVACKREIIDDFQLVFSDAGLQVRCIDCCVFCLANVFGQIRPKLLKAGVGKPVSGQKGAEAMINIGATMININILDNGHSTFVRDQPYGGNQLVRQIVKAHGVSAHAAEQIIQENFKEIRGDVLDDFYSHLVSELGRSLDYYATKHSENPVTQLYLTGGCALMPGISDELEQRLGIGTTVLNPLHYASLSRRKFDQDYINQTGPRMMVPLGLALRSVEG